MNLKKIKEELLRAAELVEDFEKNGRTIDRDAAINKIRNVYEELRFMAPPVVVAEPSAEPLVPFEPEQEDEPEVEVEFIMPEQDEAEAEVESAVEESEEEPAEAEPEEPEEVVYVAEEDEPEAEEPAAEVKPEVDEESDSAEVVEDIDLDSAFEPEEDEEATPEPAPESEPISEPTPESEPKKVVVEPSLFGDYEPISRKSTHTRRKIMALYEEEPAVVAPKPEPKPEPKVEVEPAPAPAPAPTPVPAPKVEPAADTENKVLGEVITPKTTIADTITPVVSVAEDRPVATLRGAINVVDRFMLMRDLFDDDAQLYEQTIDALEAMDNLDDCIIYIAENFAWRPSSEGAKLMMDLLQRKLG